MYIQKWWGNLVGDSDDSLCLLDYFHFKNKSKLTLQEILTDLKLQKYLGKDTLQQGKNLFFTAEHPNGQKTDIDFLFAIDPVIDLCAILLETIHSGQVDTKALDPYASNPLVFTIEIDKHRLKLLTEELSLFCSDPLRYDLSELVPEEDMLALAKMCSEINGELQTYLNTICG